MAKKKPSLWVGVDPAAAKPLALASYDGTHYEAAQVDDCGTLLALLKGLARDYRVTVVCEAPWVGPNVKTALKLAKVVGAVEFAALIAGCEVYDMVHPSTWRQRVIGKRLAALPDWKARAVKRASQLAGKTIEDEDLAEAICICRWLWMERNDT